MCITMKEKHRRHFVMTRGKIVLIQGDDRYIILDYGTDDEKVFLCGASSKDAGGRITSILEDPDRMKYDLMIKDLLKNNWLVLK